MMNLLNPKSIIAIRPSTAITTFFLLMTVSFVGTTNAETQTTSDTLGPPSLGEQTKGKPAVDETPKVPATKANATNENTETQVNSAFGSTTVTEHKRESGQVYLIELENSLGGKQYLYENDSDGQIGSSVEDEESITEIPKWKLGSW